MRAARTFLAVAFCALLAVFAAGCNDGKKSPASRKVKVVKTARVKTPLPEALAQGKTKPANPQSGSRQKLAPRLSKLAAPVRKKVKKIDVRPKDKRLTPHQALDATPSTDYEQFIAAVLPLINDFWQKKTKEVLSTAVYAPPAHLVAYNGADSPGCNGQKSADMSGNAYYCASLGLFSACPTPSANHGFCQGDDIVAWDGQGLMLPTYLTIGKLATALILAHEWGHLIQARVFPQFQYHTVIRVELQADCFAGAWALGMQRDGRVNIGDFNEALGLFEKVGGPGQAWLDPDSHGNKYQRVRSFTQGFENDAMGCVGSNFDALLGHIGLAKENPGA